MGYDIVERTIPDGISFKKLDITMEVMRKADIILCRDVFIHLPNDLIQKTLALFKESGSKYLLTSNYCECQNNEGREFGAFRPEDPLGRSINLMKEPFNFGEPIHKIEEVNWGRFICMWEL